MELEYTQITDSSALPSELNRTLRYRNNWLYLIGSLIILISVIKIVFNVNFEGTKRKAGLKGPFPVQNWVFLVSLAMF